MQGAAHGSVVPPRVLAAGMRVEITSDCTVSVGSSIGSCVVQTKRRLGVVSVVDTAANTVKVRFDLQFDEKGWYIFTHTHTHIYAHTHTHIHLFFGMFLYDEISKPTAVHTEVTAQVKLKQRWSTTQKRQLEEGLQAAR